MLDPPGATLREGCETDPCDSRRLMTLVLLIHSGCREAQVQAALVRKSAEVILDVCGRL